MPALWDETKREYTEPARTEFLYLKAHVEQTYDLFLMAHALFQEDRSELYREISLYVLPTISHMFMNDVLMNICQLTDPPSTAGNKNITLHTLAETIEPYSKNLAEISREIRARIKLEDIKKIRVRRNKYLSHLDYEFHIKKYEIPDLSISEVKSILDDFFKLMDRVAEEGLGGEMMIHNGDQITEESDKIFKLLKRGKATED